MALSHQAPAVTNAWLSFSSALQIGENADGTAEEHTSPYPGVEQLCDAGYSAVVAAQFLEKQQMDLEREWLPLFWQTLKSATNSQVGEPGKVDAKRVEIVLLEALQTLAKKVKIQRALIRKFCSSLGSQGSDRTEVVATHHGVLMRHERLLTGLLMVTQSLSLSELLRILYDAKFAEFSQGVVLCQKEAAGEAPSVSTLEDGEGSEDAESINFAGHFPPISIMGDKWMTCMADIGAALRCIGLGILNESVFSGVVYTQMQHQLSASAKGNFDKHFLADAFRYVHAVPLEFIGLLCGWDSQRVAEVAKRAEWQSRLDYYVYNTFAELRISEMFEIVVEYPESIPAVEDLRMCLCNTNNQHAFIYRFTAAVRKRLLHAGAATKDIIQQYVSTIKVLRDLDPAGVLLEAVGQPIKEYLKCRKDTIRCIVTMLTDDTEGEEEGMETLYTELKRGEAGEGSEGEEGETDEAVLNALAYWEPDPMEADPSRSPRNSRSYDVINMLIGIYGSKEVFINEYRAMLADKLLCKTDYDTQREIRTLELLKLRFGEANLHNCEVMLKDIADSKRINANIKKLPADTPLTGDTPETPADLSVFDATIVSALFWPPFKDQQMNLPAPVRKMAETFADRYNRLKAPRKLLFGLQHGTAELEVQVGDTILQFSVTALQASILLQFQEKQEWGASELADALGLPVATLRRKALYWVNAGVLIEGRNSANKQFYTAATQYSEAAAEGASATVVDEEAGLSAMEEQAAADMAIHESFVLGMLTNHEELPLAMIHNMLKMFVTGFDKTSDQVAAFLARLVREEKLALEGGTYRKRA